MKKIILYVDWTDCVAHLSPEYAEGDTISQKTEYTAVQALQFFKVIKELQQEGYQVDCHIISGGSVDMLSEMFEQICELATNAGLPNLFKSLTCEYGGDIITNDDIIKNKNQDSDRLFTSDLEKYAKESLKDINDVYFRRDSYLQNIRFENEMITEKQFASYCKRVRKIYDSEEFNIYPYFCPGYGVEIDIVPKSLNKLNAVKRINSLFYNNQQNQEVALSIFNGDFAKIDLQMVDASLTKDVLFVATEESDIFEYVKNHKLPTYIKGRKLNALTQALIEVKQKNLSLHPYDKGDYVYERTI